jgi:hypothetical protein
VQRQIFDADFGQKPFHRALVCACRDRHDLKIRAPQFVL